MKKALILFSLFSAILFAVMATDLSLSNHPKTVALWPQTIDTDIMDLLSRISASTATIATNPVTVSGNLNITNSPNVSVTNSPTVVIGNANDPSSLVTNWTPQFLVVTSTPPTGASVSAGQAGNTNTITVANATNGIILTGITFNSHTNTAYSFDLLFCAYPLTWPAAGQTANIVQTERTNILWKQRLVINSDDVEGTNASVSTNVLIHLPQSFYTYKIYRSAMANASNAINILNFQYQTAGK